MGTKYNMQLNERVIIEYFLRVRINIQHVIDVVSNRFAFSVLAVYAIGFIVWNTYLLSFGFFEFNIVQLRFISSGLLFLLPLAILSCLSFAVSGSRTVKFILTAVSILVWLFLFIIVIFPVVPQSFGGARPIPTTIIGTTEQIEYLLNFNITTADNGEKLPVQTKPVCLIYQNQDYSLVFNATNILYSDGLVGMRKYKFHSRVLTLPKDRFVGFQSILFSSTTSEYCSLSRSYLPW